jgi:hypothetical protein
VEADVINAGAKIVRDQVLKDGKPFFHEGGEPVMINAALVEDGDLVTGKSKVEAKIMAQAIARKITLVRSGATLPWV